MAESKSSKRKVGQTIEVSEGALVVRPDGTEVTVTGGAYVLSVPGSYVVAGDEIEVK